MQNEQKNEDAVWAELSEEQQQTVEKLQNTMTEDALWEWHRDFPFTTRLNVAKVEN